MIKIYLVYYIVWCIGWSNRKGQKESIIFDIVIDDKVNLVDFDGEVDSNNESDDDNNDEHDEEEQDDSLIAGIDFQINFVLQVHLQILARFLEYVRVVDNEQ